MQRKSLLAFAAMAALAAAACAPTQESQDTMSGNPDMAASADTGTSSSQGANATDPGASGSAAPTQDMAQGEAGDGAMAGMSPDRTIAENTSASQELGTLAQAVKAAGLEQTLSGQGPFTVFAPTNAAFEKLPGGTVEALMAPANKNVLTAVLAYHVVPGRITAADLARQIEAGGGKATLTTVQGATLVATNGAGGVTITDTQGNQSRVTAADVSQSNGVIHVVDNVLLPASLTPRSPGAGSK